MAVIGTAGHVDHGKTSLIYALTGIETDRLLEEKKRGLTIELGFAYFDAASGGKIGVVDVPGHEKFIRNMVSGAWGLDCVLLVVAADDGWMYQSENHLKVLSSMGIDSVILVISKTDLVTSERIMQIRNSCLEEVRKLTGRTPPSVTVSSRTGEGLEKLKSTIFTELKNNDKKFETGSIMWIDRSFSVKGTGTVVTGTLRGKPINTASRLYLYPGGLPLRVRGIQSYGIESEIAEPPCRTALNIGLSLNEVKRGSCIADVDGGFTAEKEMIIRMDKLWEDNSLPGIKNHSRLEFAMGTDHCDGIIHFLEGKSGNHSCARIIMDKDIPVRFGLSCVIIHKGGSRIVAGVRVIWTGRTSIEERGKICHASNLISTDFSPDDYLLLKLITMGFIHLKDNQVPKLKNFKIRKIHDWILTETFYLDIRNNLLNYISLPGGIGRNEIDGKIHLPENLLSAFIDNLLETEFIIEKNRRLLSRGIAYKPTPLAALLLGKIDTSGSEGWDLSRDKTAGAKKELRILVQEEKIIQLTETLFYSRDVYKNQVNRILGGTKTGELFSIGDARDRTGLSRKYIIPILNFMENEELVERRENNRIVL